MRDKQVLKDAQSQDRKRDRRKSDAESVQESLLIDITTEGLRIQIVYEQNRPMFAIGSAMLHALHREIVHEIAKVFNEVPQSHQFVPAHTDATTLLGRRRRL
jgi:chemotaxis protein MotB